MSVVQLITDPEFEIRRLMFDFYKHIFGKGERVLSAIKPEPMINSIAGTKLKLWRYIGCHWGLKTLIAVVYQKMNVNTNSDYWLTQNVDIDDGSFSWIPEPPESDAMEDNNLYMMEDKDEGILINLSFYWL